MDRHSCAAGARVEHPLPAGWIPGLARAVPSGSRMAHENRRLLREAGVVVIEVVGPRGAGKSSLIRAAVRGLPGFPRLGILSSGPDLVDASWLRRAVRGIDLEDVDTLLVEHACSPLDPDPVDIGQTARVLVLSAAGAGCVLRDHPGTLLRADLLVLSKVDLLSGPDADTRWLCTGVRRVNPGLEVLEVSSAGGRGVESWIRWIECPTNLEPFHRTFGAVHERGTGP